MLKYKAIFFDLWDTLAKISNLKNLVDKTKDFLGEDRFVKLMEHFMLWHLSNKSEKDFMIALDEDILIQDQERTIIKKFLTPKHIEKFPEIEDVLKELKNLGLKLALVSNAPPPSKVAIEKLGLTKFFDKIIFSCDVGFMKPDKEIFDYSVDALGIKPSEVLMIGDSLKKDVEGAINAGFDGILIDREGTSSYQKKISRLQDLIPIVK